MIAVGSKEFDPMSHRGSLLRVSPEEPIHAWVLAVARDIDAKVDRSVLDLWAHSALTTTFHFEVLESEDDKYYRAANLREAKPGRVFAGLSEVC